MAFLSLRAQHASKRKLGKPIGADHNSRSAIDLAHPGQRHSTDLILLWSGTMRPVSIFAATLVLLLAPAFSGPARAWNAEGHEAVGSIADSLLQEATRQKVAAILGVPLRVA